MKQLPFDSSLCDGSNGSIFMFLRPLDAKIFSEMSKWRSTRSAKCRFVDISSIILANSSILGFYNHWMLRYLTNHCVDCWFVDISSNILASRHRRSIRRSSREHRERRWSCGSRPDRPSRFQPASELPQRSLTHPFLRFRSPHLSGSWSHPSSLDGAPWNHAFGFEV